jgi:PITH domain
MQSLLPSGASSVPTADTTSEAGKWIDLKGNIEISGCYARNEASNFPMTNLFIGDSTLGCKSDADEQLILHISFQEFVKVRILK